MTAEWLERQREGAVQNLLASPHWTEDQRRTAQQMNQTWILEGRRTASRQTNLCNMLRLGRYIRKPFEEAARDDIRAYLSETATKVQRATLEGHKRFLKAFYKDLLQPEEPGHPTVVSWIKLAHPLKILKEIPPDDLVKPEEVLAMANACEHPRDRALIMLLYDSGARISELLGLRIKHIEFDEFSGVAHIDDGKTGPRPVRLIYSATDLQTWVSVHPRKSDPNSPLFWCQRARNPEKAMLYTTAVNVVKRAAKKAGVKRRLWMHLFRHTNHNLWGRTLGAEMACKRYGWVKGSPMPSHYSHPTHEQIDQIMLGKAGLVKNVEKETTLNLQLCQRCKTQNSPAAQYCAKCTLPLDKVDMMKAATVYEEVKASIPDLLELLKDKDVQRILLAKQRGVLPSTS